MVLAHQVRITGFQPLDIAALLVRLTPQRWMPLADDILRTSHKAHLRAGRP
jgi:hypothetical protein